MNLSIVIPCFNEKENIPLILERFNKVIGKRDIKVILVDNGSTDGSSQVISKLIMKYPFVQAIRIDRNQGYGYGILEGLKVSEGKYIGWTHADMQTDPKDIARAYDIIHKRTDKNIFVKGLRRGRPWTDRFFTWWMGILESTYFKIPLEDINAQPNIFPRDFVKQWVHPPYDFSLDLYALYMAKKNGMKVVRFPVRFPQRIYGESRWNTGIKSKIKFISRTLKFSYQLKRDMRNKECPD